MQAVLQADWEVQKHQLDFENLVNKLWQNDLEFFDSYYEENYDIEFVKKNIYYWNVHSFVKNAQNIADIKKVNIVQARLHIYFCDVIIKWYWIQLSNVKQMSLKRDNDIKYWKKVLINCFKKSHSNVFHALQKI